MADVRGVRSRMVGGLAVCLLGTIVACGDDDAGTSPIEEPSPYVRVPEDQPDLERALSAAGAGDTISLASGVYAGAGFRGLTIEARSIAVVGRNPDSRPVVDLEEAASAFSLRAGASLYLRDLILRNGRAAVGGALRLADAEAELVRVRIESSAARYGGAVAAEIGEIALVDCELVGNEAEELDGGALYLARADLVADRCLVTGNRAAGGGGGLSLDRSSAMLSACTLAGNRAGTGGSFRVLRSSSVLLARTIVWGDSATDGSHAASVAGSASFSLTCCAIDTSTVVGDGGDVQDLISADPEFCDPRPADASPTREGDYRIRAGSPCAADRSPCGETVGARGGGCMVIGTTIPS